MAYKPFSVFLCILLISALFILPSATARGLAETSETKPVTDVPKYVVGRPIGAYCGRNKYANCLPNPNRPRKCKPYEKCRPPQEVP